MPMSTTTLKRIDADGTITDVSVYQNSWGFGAAIWSELSQRYLMGPSAWLINDAQQDALWALARDPRVPRYWRLALTATFDQAVIEGERLKEFAHALRLCAEEIHWPNNHLLAIADDLDNFPDDGLGACFHLTSTTSNPWEEYDEATEDSHPYDIRTGDRHVWVFAYVDAPINA